MKEIQNFLKRPRYLRAIPSLVILTTAMAWAALPDLDETDDISKRAASSVSMRGASLSGGLVGPLPAPASRRSHS